MSLIDKVGALWRSLFGRRTQPALAEAVETLRDAMGTPTTGSLPDDVDALMKATGVAVAAAPPVAPAPAPDPAPAAAAPAPSKAAGKRKADAPPPGQLNLFQALPSAKKITIDKRELREQREQALRGEDYSPEKQDRRTFKTEEEGAAAAAAARAAPAKSYQCSKCPRSFTTPAALNFHQQSHRDNVQPKAFPLRLPRPPPPPVSLSMSVRGTGYVSVSVLKIGQRTSAGLEAERAAAAKKAAARATALATEAKHRERLREAEDEVDQGEHRVGSAKRGAYSVKDKLDSIEVMDRIYRNESIVNKKDGWENPVINPNFNGTPYTTAFKWREPTVRKKIEIAAGKAHAKTLLRIDKNSRRVGKYAAMEAELYSRFKARRAKKRKTSARWLTAMARHLLKDMDPDAAKSFKGGESWRRRYRRRHNLVVRRKTNIKNQTWEETKPVLQRYCRTLRERVKLTAQELAEHRRLQLAQYAAMDPEQPPPLPPMPRQGLPYASHEEVDQAKGITCRNGQPPPSDDEIDAALRSTPEVLARLAATPESFPDGSYVFALSLRVLRRAKVLYDSAVAVATTARDAAVAAAVVVPDDDELVRSEREKYGRYLPHQRANVDQVPIPFVYDMDTTYEEKGAKRVAINQLSAALSKRQATAQICFRPVVPRPPPAANAAALEKYKKNLLEQPPPTIIFRGKGNISEQERAAYPEGLVVLFQEKAWVDRPTAVAWAKQSWKKLIEADKAAGVADETSRYLMFQDNLDAQRPDRNPEYTDYLKDDCQTDSHMLPPGKTDELQPVDDGMGRNTKVNMAQEEDAWLDDDDNMEKWESNKLSAGDRRVLMATWFFKAFEKACEGRAKRAYFEHTAALMTANGQDDHLIRIEGKPKDEEFTFMEATEGGGSSNGGGGSSDGGGGSGGNEDDDAEEPEPEDVVPQREEGDGGSSSAEMELDDEDDEDEELPPTPRTPPEGFKFAAAAPTEEALKFSKQPAAAADALVGSSILFHWPVIGWHVGVIQRRVMDARVKRGGGQCNFYIHYEVDDEEVATVLQLTEYGGEDEHAWLLLEPEA